MSLALAIEAMPSDPAANGSSLCLGYGYRGDVSGDLEMVRWFSSLVDVHVCD